jgi:hypothetical protein
VRGRSCGASACLSGYRRFVSLLFLGPLNVQGLVSRRTCYQRCADGCVCWSMRPAEAVRLIPGAAAAACSLCRSRRRGVGQQMSFCAGTRLVACCGTAVPVFFRCTWMHRVACSQKTEYMKGRVRLRCAGWMTSSVWSCLGFQVPGTSKLQCLGVEPCKWQVQDNFVSASGVETVEKEKLRLPA